MDRYFGTKQILAIAMTRQAYNDYRGWDLPSDEDGSDEGYLVEYVDGGASNHPKHDGYVSWSPKDVFERAYQPNFALTFEHALTGMRLGHRVCRAGWNGKGMWLRLVDPYGAQSQFSVVELSEMDGTLIAHPYLRTVDGKMVPWLPSLTDMMATDWMVLSK